MKTLSARLLAFAAVLAALTLTAGEAAAQDAYDEGSVWNVTFVRTTEGHFDDYMENLKAGWRNVMDAAKADGTVLSYMILSHAPRSRNDWDLLLLVEYPNFAALDGLSDKMDAFAAQYIGATDDQRQEALISRGELRTIMGEAMAQELNFTN
ncbi:MAG: hypothetical protein JSV95_13040 [Gemmatimonadota bacterium]|jgi:hypothetical protein|nr:MAG: hypothetical protein JSV95_13040 [Gemmatimonadota bacterium]